MKKLSFFVTIMLIASLIAGCAGTPVVYYSDCTCPTGSHDAVIPGETIITETEPVQSLPAAEGALRTGLYITTDTTGTTAATPETEGEAKFEATLVAVLVDDNGVIQACRIDGINTSVKFGADGVITTDLSAAPQTKNELGENYGMVAWGGAIAEWDAQAAALAEFAVGKTVEELRTGAIDETGYAPEGTDLASSATIYLGGYVDAIEKAVAGAQHLGAQAGDELILSCIIDNSSCADAAPGGPGIAQMDVTLTALTLNSDSVITSCVIDAVQAQVGFDTEGLIITELHSHVPTKNELGADYGMVAWAGAIAEWNEQAAAFASYVTGKYPSEVAGIAVDESTKPTDADLASSVTIAVGGFQALIAKAAGSAR